MMCPEGEIVRVARRDPNYLDSYVLDTSVKIAHYVGNYWLLCDAKLPTARDRRFFKGPLPEGYTVCVWCIVLDMAQ
jgi:hypothetical protein